MSPVHRTLKRLERAAPLLCAAAAALAAAALLSGGAATAPDPLPRGGDATLPEAPARIAAGGEVSLGRRIGALFARRRASLAPLSQLAGADLALAQLASPVASSGDAVPEATAGDDLRVRGRPETAHLLRDAGLDLIAAAGDHIGDYGAAAVAETRRSLEAAGLRVAGAGDDRDQACAPAFARAGPLTVALFSIDAAARSPGTCSLPPSPAAAWRRQLAPRIAAARRAADLVLVAVHFSAGDRQRPSRAQRAAARAAVAAGADAVLASSSRRLQGVEVAGGVPIVYDLGDLLFDSVSERGRRGLLAELAAGSEGVRAVRFSPIEVGFGKSEPSRGARAALTVAELVARSRELGTRLESSGDAALLVLPRRPPRPPPAEAPPPFAAPPPLPLELPKQCHVAEVPEAARRAPRDFGPYRLLGARVRPAELDAGDMLWVESFWELRGDAAPGDRIYLRARAGPGFGSRQERRGNHEPCDWAWPTARWRRGVIYRDLFALRPPRDLETAELAVTIGFRRGDESLGEDLVLERLWQRVD